MRFLIAVLVSLFSLSALAQTVPPPALAAKAWALVDHATAQVLAEKDADARIEPASLTKLMTAYITFSKLKEGTLKPDQVVPVSTKAWRMEGSRMFIEPNKPVSVDELIRGVMLMAMSNKFGSLVLTTGNKSEYATGYCTLYGDMCGGFAPIKDVVKTAVFRLARWRNANDPFKTGSDPIPDRIITRPPSAELRADQTDQDSLPPYEVLDAIIARYMENDMGIAELVAEGFNHDDVEKVTRLIKINEYKRRQAAVGTRITHRSFGKDWRYPITNRFRA